MAEEVKTNEAPQIPNVTVKDLAIMVNIIDVSAQRGAWKGDELSTLGQLRDKLAVIVKALTPQEAPAAETPTEEVAEEAEEATVG